MPTRRSSDFIAALDRATSFFGGAPRTIVCDNFKAAELSRSVSWLARVSAPLAAVLVSGGFFGIAFEPAFSGLLWVGAACLVTSVVVTGVGLLRTPRQTPR
jgi:hypothetical protein